MVEMRRTTNDFASVVRDELRRLRQAYVHVLASIGAPHLPKDVADAIGIEHEVAHRMRTVADAVDPLAVCAAFLSEAEARDVVERMEKAYGASSAVRAFMERTAGFHGLVSLFADDRAQFEAMVASLSVDDRGGLLVEARRSAFRSNAVVIGSLRRATMRIDAVGPSPRKDLYSVASLACGIGHQRVRSGAPVQLATHNAALGRNRSGGEWLPLDAAAFEQYGVPIVEAFSSEGLGARVLRRTNEGRTVVLLEGEEIGTPGAIDVALGFCYPATDLLLGTFTSTVAIHTPTRRIVHEFLVHRDLPYDGVEAQVVSAADGREWREDGAPGTIPVEARVEELAIDAPGVAIGSWTHHAAAITRVVEHCGWRAADVRRYRFDLTYPMVGTSVMLRAFTS